MKNLIEKFLVFLSFATSLAWAASVQKPLTFRVYDFNIKTASGNLVPGEKPWSERKAGVIDSIKDYTSQHPTIVGLQEALRGQLDDIMKGLGPEWKFFGVGGGGDTKGEYCPIIYKSNEWELVNGTTKWLSETPDKPSRGYGSKYERIVTFAELRHVSSGRTIHYFNTHLDPHDDHVRYESVRDIITYVNHTRQGSPVFLGGDFNAKRTSAPYKYVATQMTPALIAPDPKGVDNKDKSTNSGFQFNHPKTIDFIFFQDHGSKVKVDLYEILSSTSGNVVISDHSPVIADFSI